MRTWVERVFLLNGGDLPTGRLRVVNVVRVVLFSPVYAVVWIIYVGRHAWIVYEHSRLREKFSHFAQEGFFG